MKQSEAVRNGQNYARELTVGAPCDRMFDAIATLKGVRGWWTTLVTGSDKVGGTLCLEFEGLEEHIDLRVQIARRPSEIEWSVVEHTALEEWNGTTIRFELIPESATTCRLAFQHVGLSPKLVCYDDCESGWDHFLGSLVTFAERGKGKPFGLGRKRS